MTAYALCMGVNDYSQWRAVGWTAADLPYSINNAEDFAQLLINGFGFDPANVGIQRDTWCSSGNILSAVDDILRNKAQAGDVVCVFFSGHGTRIQSIGPDGQPKPNLWYEAVVPYSGNLVTDYDLATLAGQLDYSHVNLTFILDACHSGGLRPVDGAPQPVGVPIPDDLIPVFTAACQVLAPFGLCLEDPVTALSGDVRSITYQDGHFVIDSPDDSHYTDLAKSTLLTACAADELGWQVQALQNSIFVGALKNVINAGNFQATYADMLTSVRAQADALMTQYVRSIASYSTMTSVPQLYGQKARMLENVLAPWSFSVQG
jgi:hypothetical protein